MRIFRSLLAVLLLSPSLCAIAGANDYTGFIKEDVSVDGVTLKRGEKIQCEMKAQKKVCCFQDESGDICVKAENLSRSRVKKRDLAIAAVVLRDSLVLEKNACESGELISDRSDRFKWSYGVRLKSDSRGKALIRIKFSAGRGDLRLEIPALTRTWVGDLDSACHNFKYSRADIGIFIKDYKAVSRFIDESIDGNIRVFVTVQVFGEFEEDDYKNNRVEFEELLPVDSEENWPNIK